MNREDAPLLSVVIPTFRRPDLLIKAVDSALKSAPGHVEVIVVPNGNDDSWMSAREKYRNDERVVFSPVATQHACVARNHGMRLATGKYVRFLDDDDYLFPQAAVHQLLAMESATADVGSASAHIVDATGKLLGLKHQPICTDFATSVLSPERFTQPVAHVFRRGWITAEWDESLPVRQDTMWMLALARSPTCLWLRTDEPVGAWVQHSMPRLFRGRHPGKKSIAKTAESIWTTAASLSAAGALSREGRIAAADGLWSCVQKGLMYDLQYWRQVADLARTLAAARHPPSVVYKLPLVRRLDPLLVETILLPLRWAHWLARKIQGPQ